MSIHSKTPDTKGLSLERLLSFCQVVEAGGLARAAETSGRDLSQMSRQFSDLESFFGCPLAERTRRDFKLNDFGEDLFELASGFFHSVANLRDRCAKEPQEVFSLAAGGGLVSWLLFPRVDSLRTAQPGARFVIKSHKTKDIINGVTSNQIDFGLVRRSAVTGRRLGFHEVGTLNYSLFVTRDTAFEYQIGSGDSALVVASKVPLLLIDSDGEFREKIERHAHERNIALSPVIECSSFTDAAIAVASGEVCSILPDLAAQYLVDFDCMQLSLTAAELSRQICLIWSKAGLRTGGKSKRLLLDHLKDRLKFGQPARLRRRTHTE